MASKNKRDVVARLVSKKLRSRIILGSCSSSEEDSLDHEGKIEEKESFESIQEKAGRCKHGPPTDYPCHLCCHQKWVSTRRLDQPLVDRENGRGQGHIVHIGGSEQLSGDVQAKSKEKKREHSEETRGDKADILFDGITVGPKTKKANSEMNTAGKNYGFNVPPGVTITAGGPLKSKTSYTPNDVVITPISAKEVTITTGVPFKSETSSASKSTPNDLVITPILRKEATITTGGPPNNSSTLKEVLITPMSTKEASLHEEEQKQLKEIVKKTNWAEVFRMSGVSVLGKPVPAPSEAEVVVEGEFKRNKATKEWECTFCTFLNIGEDRTSCKMCQGERKNWQGGEVGEDLVEVKKQCPFCTLLNLPHCKTCAACEGVLY